MHKRRKKIKLSLVWLIGLMLFSHAVIPHHHHFDSVFEHSQETNHSDEKSQHCHAFNDLYAIDIVVSFNNISINDNILFIISNSDLDDWVLFSEKKTDTDKKRDIPPEEKYFNNSPTRGSPIFI